MVSHRSITSARVAHHQLNEHTYIPWEGPVATAARLRSQRGAEAYGESSTVCREETPRRHSDADRSFSLTLDVVSQLERDISTALVVTRERKNSFAHINRIPLDVLCLIPTHLSSQKDRFRVTFVCRHWRRAFLHHGALWSQFSLGNDEECVKTFLERAKGSALDVVTD